MYICHFIGRFQTYCKLYIMSNTLLHSNNNRTLCISKFEFAHLGKKSKVKYLYRRRGYHSRRHDGGNKYRININTAYVKVNV